MQRPTTISSLTRLAPLPSDSSTHQDKIISFSGSRGELFRIVALENDIVRVQMWPDGAPRLARTWMFGSSSSPREGRLRDDLSAYSCPPLQIGDNGTQFSTSVLKIQVRARVDLDLATDIRQVRLHDACLSWSNTSSFTFARDLSDRSYCYNRTGRSVSHYLERQPSDKYYGFGEKSGYLGV